MKNPLVNFGMLHAGDEFVFEGTCFMVMLPAGYNWGTAMSQAGRIVKFNAVDQVRQV